jgi:outer membrane protein TolC
VPTSFDNLDKAEYLKIAWSENPEILSAQDTATKARADVTAAKTAFIPDITAYARHSYQDGVPFLVHNFGTFGVTLSYDVFDFGKRRGNVRAQEDVLAEAEENLRKLKDDVAVSIEQSYNKMERTKSMVDVARQVFALRDENDRLAGNQLTYGVVQVAERRQASAARYKAQADLLQASLGYLLARAELEQAEHPRQQMQPAGELSLIVIRSLRMEEDLLLWELAGPRNSVLEQRGCSLNLTNEL